MSRPPDGQRPPDQVRRGPEAKDVDRIRRAIAALSAPSATRGQQQSAADHLLAEASPSVIARVTAAAEAAGSARRGVEAAERLNALAAEMESRLPEPEPPTRRTDEDHEAVIRAFLNRSSTPQQREEAEEQLEDLPGPLLREVVRRVGDALEGIWAVVRTPADVEARRVIARWYLDMARLIGVRVLPLMPDFLKVTTADGRTGTLRAGYGTGLYNFHYEFPVSGLGVRKDEIFVVEDDRRTPVLEWLQREGLRVICTRCGGFVDRKVERRCPGRELGLRARRGGAS
jgi:hypothetical protein